MSRSVLLTVKNVADEIHCENKTPHFIFNIPPPPENRAFYEIMWKNIVDRSRPRMTIWFMRIACWIPWATNTNPTYIMLIDFPLQQCLQKSASALRYTYSGCLANCNTIQSQKSLTTFPSTQCGISHSAAE